MAVYTANQVERLLKFYLDIRCTLEGNCQQLPDTYTLRTKKKRDMENQPFGQTARGDAWPFMEPKHANPPSDGKAKARLMEELHVSVLDIERALPRLSEDDQQLLLDYYILQSKTLDELAAERGNTSRGSMQQRCARAVKRMTQEMEHAWK